MEEWQGLTRVQDSTPITILASFSQEFFKMTKYKTIKNRFITEFIEKYSDESKRHFIQVLKQWRDLEK